MSKSLPRPTVSVIVPVLNQADRLRRLLSALRRQRYGAVEIIVVDNGSTDGSQAVAQELADRFLVDTRMRSPYPCRNTGIRAATGDILMLLDVNCMPGPDYVSAMVAALPDDRTIAKALLVPETPVAEMDAHACFDYINSDVRPYDGREYTALPCNAVAFHRRVVAEIGLFLPDVRSLADIEWTRRAHARGMRLILVPGAKVSYPFKSRHRLKAKGRRTGGGVRARWLRQHGRYGFAWPFFVVKHFLPPSPSWFRWLAERNRKDGTGLSPVAIFFLAWWYKAQIGTGLLQKKK